jgi:hypothetical protein
VSGTTNLGGGGGGGIKNNSGGAGGSGVVVLAYNYEFDNLTSIDAGLTYTLSVGNSRPGWKVYTFTAGTGNITI